MNTIRLLKYILFLFSICSIFSQYSPPKKYETSLRIFYNYLPDSLYINKELVFIESNTIIPKEPGIYEIRAVRECYSDFYEKLTLLPNYIKPVNIKLKRKSTFEYSFYKYSFYLNIGGMAYGLLRYDDLQNGYQWHFLSNSLARLSYLFINFKQFDPCNRKFIGFKTSQNSFRIKFNICMETVKFFKSLQQSQTYVWEGYWNIFVQTVYWDIKTEQNKYNPSVNIEIQLDLLDYLFAELSAGYFPFSKISVKIIERFPNRGINREITDTLSPKSPFKVEQSLNFIVFKNINQIIGFTFGGYYGNPFHFEDKTIVLPVEHPYLPPSLYENDSAIIKLKYATSYGVFTGFFSNTPVTNHINFLCKIRYYTGAGSDFFTVNSGLSYKIF